MKLATYRGSYVSLYSTITPEHTRALEEAISATVLGHFDSAEAIFERRLPPSHTTPVLALEHASLYEKQGLDLKRVELLRKTLTGYGGWKDKEVGRERWLMEFILRRAEVWVYGTLDDALAAARTSRDGLANVPLDEYTDVDVAYVIHYYNLMHSCRLMSNWVDETTDGAFPSGASNTLQPGPWKGLLLLRATMQGLGRHREALRLFEEEVRFASDLQWLEDFKQTCAAVYMGDDAVSMVQAAQAMTLVSKNLGSLEDALNLLESARVIRDILADCIGQATIMHLDHCIEAAAFWRSPSGSLEERSMRHVKFADAADELKDYWIERLHLLSAADEASEAHTRKNDAPTWEAFQRIHSRRIRFESETTQSGYYLAASLCNIGLHAVFTKRESEFIEHLADFESRFPEYNVPMVNQNLYDRACDAARSLGDHTMLQRYLTKRRLALMHSPFTSVGLDGSILLNPTDKAIMTQREFDISLPSTWPQTAVNIMLRWIRAEVKTGLATLEQAKEILGMTGDNPTCQHVIVDPDSDTPDLLDSIDPAVLSIELYGISAPAPPEIWIPRFQRIEDWLRREGLPPSEEARHVVLEMMQHMRVQSYRIHPMKGTTQTEYDMRKAYVYEVKKRLDVQLSLSPNVVGETKIQLAKKEVCSSVYELACSPQAVEDGVVTDDMLKNAVEAREATLVLDKSLGRPTFIYFGLTGIAKLMYQRYLVFKSVHPTAGLPFLSEADEVYCEVRRERSISKSAVAVGAKQTLADTFGTWDLYGDALRMTWEAWSARRIGHTPLDTVSSCPAVQAENWMDGDKLHLALFQFLEWAQKSKARGLTDGLGLGARLPSSMLGTARQSKEASTLLEKESQLVLAIESAPFEKKFELHGALRDIRGAMRAVPALGSIMRIRDGSSISLAEIQALAEELGPNTVFVDYVHFSWREGVDIIMVLYRDGRFQTHTPITVTLAQVETWVHQQLEVIEPLKDARTTLQLAAMEPLIRPLESFTCPGDTLVLCPTRILHRVPLHAITFKSNNQPLIARNPIIYTQSLSILRLCVMSLQADALTDPHQLPPLRTAVVHPLPQTWSSSQHIASLASRLNTLPLLGPRIPKPVFLSAVTNASLIHYHGHVSFSDTSPLERHLVLDPEGQDPSLDANITADEIFDLPLAKPALVILIGCSSNRASLVSKTDELRGLPTAFLYAGASSVVSALWPILDEDGARFSEAFYGSLARQAMGRPAVPEGEGDGDVEMADEATEGKRARGESGGAVVQEEGEGEKTGVLDLAKAMQEAVLVMKGEGGEALPAHHWAGYVLNGAWRMPNLRHFFTGS